MRSTLITNIFAVGDAAAVVEGLGFKTVSSESLHGQFSKLGSLVGILFKPKPQTLNPKSEIFGYTYIYIHTFLDIYIYRYRLLLLWLLLLLYIHTCVYVCVYVCIYIYIYISVYGLGSRLRSAELRGFGICGVDGLGFRGYSSEWLPWGLGFRV